MIPSGNGDRRPAGRPVTGAFPERLTVAFRLGLVVLALAVAAAGLGAAAREPLPRGGLPVAIAVVVAALFVIGTLRAAVAYRGHLRMTYARTAAHDRLRTATLAVMITAAVAVPVLAVALHRGGSTASVDGTTPGTLASGNQSGPALTPTSPPHRANHSGSLHIPIGTILLVLGIIALVAALVAAALLAARLWRVPVPAAAMTAASGAPVAGDADLAEALEAGRGALTGQDARTAIIACYAAMEDHLGAVGEARRRSDSPTDLLRRATARHLVTAAPAARLTALFREARYSTHPMPEDSLAAARAALDAIAAELAAMPDDSAATVSSGTAPSPSGQAPSSTGPAPSSTGPASR